MPHRHPPLNLDNILAKTVSSLHLLPSDSARRIAALAEHFPPHERAILKAIYADGLTPATLARTLGLPTRDLRRRLERLTTRVAHPAVELIALEHARRATLGRAAAAWPDHMLEVATACIIHGRSLRAAAATLALSLHAVRTHRDAVLALANHHAPHQTSRDSQAPAGSVLPSIATSKHPRPFLTPRSIPVPT